MKSTIYIQKAGNKPVVYEQCQTLKEAKKILFGIWEHSLESDDLQTIAGKLTNNNKNLTLPSGDRFFVEQNRSL